MGMMIAEVFEALLEAGASESKANAAAVSLAGCDYWFFRIGADLLAIKWMVGAVIVGVISLVIEAFVV